MGKHTFNCVIVEDSELATKVYKRAINKLFESSSSICSTCSNKLICSTNLICSNSQNSLKFLNQFTSNYSVKIYSYVSFDDLFKDKNNLPLIDFSILDFMVPGSKNISDFLLEFPNVPSFLITSDVMSDFNFLKNKYKNLISIFHKPDFLSLLNYINNNILQIND